MSCAFPRCSGRSPNASLPLPRSNVSGVSGMTSWPAGSGPVRLSKRLPSEKLRTRQVLQEPNGQPSADEATHDGESTAEPGCRVSLTCAVNLQTRESRVAVGGPRLAGNDHAVRWRCTKLGKSLRESGPWPPRPAWAALTDERRPQPSLGAPSPRAAEDDPVRTIVPRLTAAGADLTKIHILESVILANGCETLPSLRADIDAITAAATRLGDCRLIAIDPVSAYLKGVDDNRNAVLRGVLTPLKRLAEHLGAAALFWSATSPARPRPTASTGSWARSPMWEPAAPTIFSLPITATRPVGASSSSITGATSRPSRCPWRT